MRSRLLVVLAALALSPGAVASRPALLSDIAATIRDDCHQGRFSGVVVVKSGARTLLALACNPSGAPHIDATSRFKLFSISKMFTGTAIARLVEDGRIDPHAPLERYLDHLPAQWRKVSILQVQQHTSGIPDLTNQVLEEFQAGAPDHRTAMQRVLRKAEQQDLPLAFAAGSKFAYDNFGYELLAQVAAQVTGKPFDQLLRELVLLPAGMHTATVARPRFTTGKLDGSETVAGLVAGFNGKPGALEPADSFSFVQLGAGAMIASAADLFAYDRALRTGRLLSAAAQGRVAAQAFDANAKVRYGYGVMYRKSGTCAVLEHSGGTNGYVSDYARIPQHAETVVILSNFGFADVEGLRVRIVDRLTAARSCAA